MGERDFQTEVIDRLGRIEERQNMTYEQVQKQQDDMSSLHDIAVRADQAAKSAHHRIDGMYAQAGLIGALVAFLTDIFFRKWN